MIFPNSNSMALDGALIRDEHGGAGLAEPLIEIDNHYDDVIKTLAAGTAIDKVIDSIKSTAGNIFGNTEATTTKDLILQNTVLSDLSRKPTITMEPGKLIYIILEKDIIMEPYIS